MSNAELSMKSEKEVLRRSEAVEFMRSISQALPYVEGNKPVPVGGKQVPLDFSNDKFYDAFLGMIVGKAKSMQINVLKGEAFLKAEGFLNSMRRYMSNDEMSNTKAKVVEMIENCFQGPNNGGGEKIKICSYPSEMGKIRSSQKDVVSFYTSKDNGKIQLFYNIDRTNGSKKTTKAQKPIYTAQLQ
jgi:hypothetical protein